MSITLQQLNSCSVSDFALLLNGVYEHSPWVAQRAEPLRPFVSITALKIALQNIVLAAGADEQIALICAHPDLAGTAALSGTLTRESTTEQSQVGLLNCSAEVLDVIRELNVRYRARFGFPFILAVKGPDGKGLRRQTIISTFERRLRNARAEELSECLYQISRIAELRLNDLFGVTLKFGNAILARSDVLAAWTDGEPGLTCAYLTEAHRKVAQQLAEWMRAAGMQVVIDAVGNVVGRYASDNPDAKTFITGSHYDTVNNAGKYDGRQGILVPIAVVQYLHERGEKLPFHLEVIGFSEEEGVRFKSTFLGSSAVAGRFDLSLLDRTDAAGVTMRSALSQAGHDVNTIAAIARKPDTILGYLEVHIEQGPVLLKHNLPVGIVTSIAGSSRYIVELTGVASHAGTTPMTMRRDAAVAAAELVLFVEQRCSGLGALVGTVGQLQVPNGSVNVIPNTCVFSLDIRAEMDTVREQAVADILNRIEEVCTRRGIRFSVNKLMSTAAVQCDHGLMAQLRKATESAGVPILNLSSGAGHDAMVMATLTPVAMLFTRCGNGGISHNPLETMTADDADIAAHVFLDFLKQLLW